ncbi:MAG: type II secretion system protein GspK [Phycisphaerae bacterium]|nr:type II secretion system protein GspK [Phycisphaerae bacterium]MDD5381511.1 type II secretion system protein GspK [Phycisphaerae bacterium]
MWNKSLNNCSDRRNRPGIVLLVTLVLLVMLSALGYTLSSRLAAQRHREQYIVDYQAARYGCNSAARYALAELQDVNMPQLIERPNEPDFSDLFTLSEVEYKELLAEFAAEGETYSRAKSFDDKRDIKDINDINDINDVSEADDTSGVTDFNDPNLLIVRGPYGPPWPFVFEPLEFEIGSAKVRIEIEDENAKYPLGWMLLADEGEERVHREASAGFETFCEWMDVNSVRVDSLKKELKEIGKIKTFKLDFEPVTISEERRTVSSTGRKGRRTVQRRTVRTTTAPASVHSADFAKIFHSSLIDTETLAMPTILSENRKESALKYMGLWASNRVNINTAPRQVLEVAFTFGGDADKIAEEIIQRRRIKPFTDIEDLKRTLFRYSDSIGKCEKYITTASTFFTVRITVVSGVAEASTVIAITKQGKKLEKIAVISG